MTNKALGNKFEKEFCETLGQYGFWVHNFQQNAAGQPVDVIAVKNGEAFLIDCKVCKKDYFTLSRIEENQDLSMTKWEEVGNNDAYFALLIRNEIWMVKHSELMELKESHSRITYEEIRWFGCPLERWL